jgi:hypothetical protein
MPPARTLLHKTGALLMPRVHAHQRHAHQRARTFIRDHELRNNLLRCRCVRVLLE